jgi:TolA-binding protein
MTIEVCNVLCSGNRNINWFCDKCVSRVKAMITDDKETDYIALMDRQQEMNEKIGKLEKKIEEGLQEMKETMDEENGNKLSALEKRLDDLEKKTRKNVIRKTFRELWNLRLKRHKALGPPFERWAD